MPILGKRLQKELRDFGRDPKNYEIYHVTQHETRASVGIRSIIHKAVVTGKTNNYTTHVQFFDVDFIKAEDKRKKKEKEKVKSKGKGKEKEPEKGKQKEKPGKEEEPKVMEGYIPIDINGQLWYYKKPSIRKNPMHLRCHCPDFRFRFEKQLYDKKGLVGNWRRYKRKTPPPPEGRPHANPENKLGFCKHIWSFLTFLKNAKLIEE